MRTLPGMSAAHCKQFSRANDVRASWIACISLAATLGLATHADLEGVKVMQEIVAPQEQVGQVFVSEKQVRPRKMRAMAILTLLAFCGSLGLVFVVEYVVVNREEITRQRPAA